MNWNIDHHSGVPLHLQIESLLRELIQQEEYQEGKLLPSEKEIATKLAVSRNTVRQAMQSLVREGLITRKKGVGSRVNPDTVRTGLKAWSSFTKEMEDKGIDVRDLQKQISRTSPPEEVADALQIDSDTSIYRLERLRGDGDEPIVLFVSYFHPRIGIESDEKFNGLLYEILEEKYNIIPAMSSEKIGAETPDEQLREDLDIPSSTPILYRQRLVCDAAERPIEYCNCYYRSDRFEYDLQINREDF